MNAESALADSYFYLEYIIIVCGATEKELTASFLFVGSRIFCGVAAVLDFD